MDISVLMDVALPLLVGVLMDCVLGDPMGLPHPVVGYGRLISLFEHRWNHGQNRKLKGMLMTVLLVAGVAAVVWGVLVMARNLSVWLEVVLSAVLVFYCLAGKTLIDEVQAVFRETDISLERGRKQVARIVGRDTSELTAQEVRIAALETLAENLSDGVVAPLFWYMVAGVPGMMAYKMVNTLDSMVGYKNERYRNFGCFAARLDDVANYIPARLTALLMVLVSGRWSLLAFVKRYGRQHASPNSGYPESALAGILDCRFGGPHVYFGQVVDKPWIGENCRAVNTADMQVAVAVNRRVEAVLLLVYFLIVGCIAW
ncbi:MAG: adenosylcobinamide-phosphate synthase CbiB [Phocaeicola sp.]|nr:adenosylcobinamide-phosphate synthase CbiB [Phocaeicola sp.]